MQCSPLLMMSSARRSRKIRHSGARKSRRRFPEKSVAFLSRTIQIPPLYNSWLAPFWHAHGVRRSRANQRPIHSSSLKATRGQRLLRTCSNNTGEERRHPLSNSVCKMSVENVDGTPERKLPPIIWSDDTSVHGLTRSGASEALRTLSIR